MNWCNILSTPIYTLAVFALKGINFTTSSILFNRSKICFIFFILIDAQQSPFQFTIFRLRKYLSHITEDLPHSQEPSLREYVSPHNVFQQKGIENLCLEASSFVPEVRLSVGASLWASVCSHTFSSCSSVPVVCIFGVRRLWTSFPWSDRQKWPSN